MKCKFSHSYYDENSHKDFFWTLFLLLDRCHNFWMLDVSRTASYEITLIRLSIRPFSVCLSVCPSLSFLKIGSLVFSDIVHDDSSPWYLVTDRARFLKKNWWPKFGPKSGPKVGVFLQFLKFGSLVFLEIAYSDNLQQCLTCRGKIQEKISEA